jgi:hypothetical protein
MRGRRFEVLDIEEVSQYNFTIALKICAKSIFSLQLSE